MPRCGSDLPGLVYNAHRSGKRYLGLAGDASDNIPGVPGIGPKTAQKLIATYGSMENLLEHTNELKGKQKENLETFRDQALLSKELVTIKCDVPLSLDLNDFGAGTFNSSNFRSLLQTARV